LTQAIYRSSTRLAWEPFGDVEALETLDLPIGIISNWDKTLRKKLHSLFSFKIDRLIISSEQGVRKPDAEIYMRAIRGLKLSEAEIMYVGDSISLDMEPAKEIGLRAVLLDRLDIHPDYSDLKIRTLNELSSLL
jgi:FMN phosphatase YigB (HAD superfamily)